VLALAFPPAALWPIAFVALIPFLWAVRESRPRRGFLLGFVFGFAYFGAQVYWILLFGELAWSGLTSANALYTAVFGLFAPVVWRRERPVRSVVGLAALWTAFEFARGSWPLGGLTWGDVAYSQAPNPFLLPLASVTGALGLSFVVALVNGLLFLALMRWGRGKARSLGLVAVALALVLAPAPIPASQPSGQEVDVAAIQVPVPKGLALDPLLEDRLIAEMHADAHRTLASSPPDLVIWAENALDQDPTRDPSLGRLVTGAIREVGAPTLAGAITGPPGGRQYNQSLLYDSRGKIVDRYTKVHLVPFGEFVPWRDRLGFLELLRQIPRDLTPGKSLQPLKVDGLEFANVICFENAFPEIDRTLIARGAQFLVVSTNNASYLRTAAASQHLAMSRLRAVENGRWVVHSAISGISAFVDPEGRVYDSTQLFEPAIIRRTITASTSRTIYNRFGNWFAWLSVVVAVGLMLVPRRRENRRGAPGPLPERPRTLVILPTYNERDTIAEVLSRLLELPGDIDILVVDDNSPDGTADIALKMGGEDAPIRVLRRPAKAGLATAYLTGFESAVRDGYDLIVEMDSDLSHQPEELPALLAAARTHDLTIGSRYVAGGSVTNWGAFRRALSRAGNRYARLALGFPLTDATSGFRVYRKELIRALLADGIHSEGYGFQIELAYRTWLHGFDITDVPITFREREHGHSKISRRIVLEALALVTLWGVRERLRPDSDPAQRP